MKQTNALICSIAALEVSKFIPLFPSFLSGTKLVIRLGGNASPSATILHKNVESAHWLQ